LRKRRVADKTTRVPPRDEPSRPTNGSGSSRGRTNGLVNGMRVSFEHRRVSVADISGVRRKLFVVVVLVAIALVIPYVLVYSFPPDRVEIDGYFLDWLDAQVYTDESDNDNPDISITGYGLHQDAFGTSFYVSTAGELMAGRDGAADGFYIFMDRDGNASTGYGVRGLGADALVLVTGWNGTVELSSAYSFDPSADRTDYGGFRYYESPKVVVKGGEMELRTSLGGGPDMVVAVCARSTGATDDWSEVNFGDSGSALRVVQDHVAAEVFPEMYVQDVLTLTMYAKGPSAFIEEMRFDVMGNNTSWTSVSVIAEDGRMLASGKPDEPLVFPSPLEVPGGRSLHLSVRATFPAGSEGTSFGLSLRETDGLMSYADMTFCVETRQSGAAVGYILYAPSDPIVDGAFGDWTWMIPVADAEGDALDEEGETGAANSDISGAAVSSTDRLASFYMSVNGSMLAGCDIPAGMARWADSEVHTGGPSNITRSMHGVDSAFVFIDTDQNQSTGYEVGGSEVSMVVLGKGGHVISARIYDWDGSDWSPGAHVDAALDAYQLELSAGLEQLGLDPATVYTVTFAAEDWRGYADDLLVYMPMLMPSGYREFGGIVINEIFSTSPPVQTPTDWIELYNTGTEPVSIDGWILVVSGGRTYTFPAVVLEPGDFYVMYDLEFFKTTTYWLLDADYNLVDTVTLPFWKLESYGRIGTPEDEYATWDGMYPTPGEINIGQVPIPEFGDLLMPLAIVPIMLFAIRRARRSRDSSKDERV
jgi:hypothetical protein